MRRLTGGVAELDRAAFLAVARARTPLDPALPVLSRLADHGLLWLAVAAALAARPGRTRRAALRGAFAIGLASTVTNGPLKWTARRSRPPLDEVLHTRRLPRQPRTTSFPSGHAASAAAFATGVALELGWPALPVAAVAGAVAYSRVHTGVHYPGDVLAGAAIGSACALATAHWWPPVPDAPAEAPEPAAAPALPDGAGLVVVVNPGSGRDDGAELAVELRERLPAATVRELGEGDDLADALREAASVARVLGVAGGDGSVRAAAELALERGLPLLVVPAGTLNHFARDLGVTSADDAVRAVQAGEAVRVDVADAADHAFLNTGSVGGYPEIVALRRRLEPRLGKLPALALATARVLRRHEPLEVTVDGVPRRLWLLFCGNCGYQPAGFAPSRRPRLDDGVLDVRLLSAEPPLARTRLVLGLLTGTLAGCPAYERRTADRLDVRSADGPLRVALDGEDAAEERVVRFGKRGRLVVYRPAVSAAGR